MDDDAEEQQQVRRRVERERTVRNDENNSWKKRFSFTCECERVSTVRACFREVSAQTCFALTSRFHVDDDENDRCICLQAEDEHAQARNATSITKFNICLVY